MSGVLAKLYAFLYLRGFRVWVSYRTQMVLNVLSWVLPVFTYYFVGTSLGKRITTSVHIMSYTSFFVVGLAFQGYVSSSIVTISQRLRNEQLYGTLEYYVLSPVGVFGFLTYSAVWGFTLNTLNAAVILAVGAGLGVSYSGANMLGAAILVLMLVASTFGIGMMSAALVMVTKQGNPISFFFSTFTTLMSGTVFPVNALPYVVRLVSYALPLTWALDGLRLALLQGATIIQLSPYITIMGVFDLVTIPLGAAVYKLCFDYVRRKGTISQY
ncbi:ABC transporter [Candidatus Marsarchaeota G2 archaeon ECH_B_2]|uniref:ABC transporter n=3 Tax=Candidatus Marsarchaeota group 2 TaxID=2203771 RepID=A0A2R6BCC3_9ARCH|nr:MAG: ABC transporter [Candidatus Marsarchaeota G2 archaeon ECH_B_2]PSO00226.1 MAG: ABC transporter [Candidatus Marsarchaeota G2 archaeon ECH_B_3]PSO02722.1 MAG: ABC transporter [Candidatus Marsarchaeota G2 archaeon ECH_B_1]